MKCPRCQHENPADAVFCQECGTRLEVTCPGCGTTNQLGAKFCKKCGFNMYGLGFGSDGTLFANGLILCDVGSHLFTSDLTTGAATDIGPHGVTLGRPLTYSGLAFRADGTLLSLGSITASEQGLSSVDPSTGAATLLGNTMFGFGVDGGLAFGPE